MKPRKRLFYAILILLVIALGLLSRHFAKHLPVWNQLYLGDALWALMIFFMIGFIFKRRKTAWVAICALIFSFCIEFSQIYHAPWIDAIRANRLGGLVLGYGFLWSDLLCYCAGIIAGYLLEKYLINDLNIN
jgi:hypothetical protein